MSLRIGSNIASLYNATRINQSQDIDRASRVEQQSPAASDNKGNRGSANQYISQAHGGVVKTRVADANAFQKAQLDSSRGRIEDMADKLYPRLPDILADMKKFTAEPEQQAPAARVAVTERNAAAVAERQAAQPDQLVNFTL